MKINTENLFQYVLGASALFVASIAAFFSIAGIGMLFSGSMISVMLMASSLELGKIVGTSFLYRYWDKATKLLKVYLSVAIFVLVIITSLGVFGWLSSAYQTSSHEYEMSKQQTTMLVEQRKMVQSQVDMTKQRVDMLFNLRTGQETRMNEALSNPVLSRNPTALRQVQEQNIEMIKRTDADLGDEKKKYNEALTLLSDADKKILESKGNTGKTKDIMTFQFVADAIGLDLTTTVKWFIVVIICVFDPLAICLILAYNVMVYGDKKKVVTVQPDEPTPSQLLTQAPSSQEVSVNTIIPPVVASSPVIAESLPELKSEPVTPEPVVEAPVVETPTVEAQPNVTLPPSPQMRDYELFHAPTR